LKVHGQVQLRPMVCEGPGRAEAEFTFLLGATEESWDYVPANAPIQAAELRYDLLIHPTRRTMHERVS
jgi:hypothetical protein